MGCSEELSMFGQRELKELEKATQIAEEVTTDHFALTDKEWAKSPFFVSTVGQSTPMVEVPDDCFAHLVYFGKDAEKKDHPVERCGYFKIFVNDPTILKWLKKRPCFGLLPLLTYVMTHELVHIARFLRFHCHPLERLKTGEEEIVTRVTHNILERVKMEGLIPILEYFQSSNRRCEYANI